MGWKGEASWQRGSEDEVNDMQAAGTQSKAKSGWQQLENRK